MVEIAEADGNGADLADWATSTRLAYELGEEFSQHLPISNSDNFNDRSRVYRGPVVAVVNAEHLLLWRPVRRRHRRLRHRPSRLHRRRHRRWRRQRVDKRRHPVRLPRRQTPAPTHPTRHQLHRLRPTHDPLRSSAGLAIEDIGVSGDERYDMTQTDLTDGNTDLAEFCTNLLTAT